MTTERIHKLIAHSGYASRRHAEVLISKGRVEVDGQRATIGQRVDPATVRITVDGVLLPVRPDLVHYLLYKPLGVISTTDDPHAERTVVDLVNSDTRVYPVGRLDADSEGLLIVTNDGDLTHLLTHPRYGVTKTYVALLEGAVSDATIRRLTDGIELDDGPAAAVSARLLDRQSSRTLVEIVMGEGRNREVRRMVDTVGHPALTLTRTAIGPLRDRSLRSGDVRPLILDEVRKLYAAAGKWEDAPPPSTPGAPT